MKTLAFLAAAFLFAQPAFAEPKVSEAELMKNLTDLSVCMQINFGGMNKLGEIIREMIAGGDKSLLEDERHTLEKAMADHNNFQVFLGAESFMGAALVNHLMDDYGHTMDDLNTKLKDTVETTYAEMETLFKDVKEYDEFNNVFIPKLNHCTTVIQQLGDVLEQLKDSDKPLEKGKDASI